MAERGEHVLITHVDGELVELPGTLAGIRAGLPDDAARAEFDEAIAHAPLDRVAMIAARLGLPDRARAEDDAAFERLRAGDLSGLVWAEDVHLSDDQAGGDGPR